MFPRQRREWIPQHPEALDGSLVAAALQQLDEKYLAPLAMFYLEELSYKEMAEVLGLPIGTIMSRLSRGKEILRRRLQAPSPNRGSEAGLTRSKEHETKTQTRPCFQHARRS